MNVCLHHSKFTSFKTNIILGKLAIKITGFPLTVHRTDLGSYFLIKVSYYFT